MAKQPVDPRLLALLDELKSTPERDPRAAARTRGIFLGQAVSLGSQRRHSIWSIFQNKERYAMNLVVSLMVMAGLLFGGGATLAAAQDDIPGEPLYQLKLAGEEAGLRFAFTPEARIERLMEQAQTRLQEMQQMAAEGIVPPAGLQLQAQERIEQALRIAAGLDDPALVGALQQIREQLRLQDQLMLQDGSCTDCEPVMEQARTMLQEQLRQVEDDLSDPRAFRERYMSQEQNRTNSGDCEPGTPCDPAQLGDGEQNQVQEQQQEQQQQQNQDGTGEPQGNGSPGGNGP